MYTPISGAMHTPFTGVLLQPESSVVDSTSEVTTEDGRPLAIIRRRSLSARTRFEILEPAGGTLLATGSLASLWGHKYELMGPGSQFLLQMKFGAWTGPTGAGTVTLPDGRELYTKGVLTGRRFTITDGAGSPVAHLRTTSKALTLKRAGVEFALDLPLLTMVQAIGLAQILRAALEAGAAAAA